jgi:arsenate reductase-like glutaredoxin family protein
MPELLETPEVYDILLKFSMLNNFGGAYTLKNIDDESYQELQLIQICLLASAKAQEFANKKNTFYSKDFN